MATTRRSNSTIGLLTDARSDARRAALLARPANFRRTQQRVRCDARRRLEQMNFEDAAASGSNASQGGHRIVAVVPVSEAPVRRAIATTKWSAPLWWAAYAAWRLVDGASRLRERSGGRRSSR